MSVELVDADRGDRQADGSFLLIGGGGPAFSEFAQLVWVLLDHVGIDDESVDARIREASEVRRIRPQSDCSFDLTRLSFEHGNPIGDLGIDLWAQRRAKVHRRATMECPECSRVDELRDSVVILGIPQYPFLCDRPVQVGVEFVHENVLGRDPGGRILRLCQRR
ncbi:hypothetical protein [Leifsonia poae]|uniref:hypothetical protein n=1 Tax=Leifsonia poae TaxID=110933 RepID=UPI003D674815